MEYVIVDSSHNHVGSFFTDPRTGSVIATVQILSEPIREYRLRDTWCDVNWDGFTNGVDYDLFLKWFTAGDPRADFDRDGWVTGLDVESFRQLFLMGGF